MDFTLRRVHVDDLPALLEHFQTAFGRWPWVETPVSPLDHLAWKTEPGPGPPQNFVAELDGKIVAAKLHHIWPVKVRDRELRTVRGYDSSVHPDYQNRGVMVALRNYAIREMTPLTHLLCGGSHNPVMEGILQQGDRVAFAHRWSVLTHDFALHPTPPATTSWALRTIDRFDERIDAFCREASMPFDFIMVRSQQLLNWRYADRRAGDFTIRLAEEEGRVLGYAVVRKQRDVGHICDVLAVPGRLDVVESLARDAAACLRRLGVREAQCWLLASHAYTESFTKSGYVRTARKTPPTLEAVNVPRSDIAFLAAPDAAVHFAIGDTDLV